MGVLAALARPRTHGPEGSGPDRPQHPGGRAQEVDLGKMVANDVLDLNGRDLGLGHDLVAEPHIPEPELLSRRDLVHGQLEVMVELVARPQRPQNRASAWLGAPQCGQFMALSLAAARAPSIARWRSARAAVVAMSLGSR